MDNFLINYFSNTKNCVVKKTISVFEWFDLIKYSSFSTTISDARNGDINYDEVKLNSIPCVTYNFTFNSYKNNENIIDSTGLLYIDIDAPDFNINKLDKNLIFAYYKSFGGLGYGIVVKVDNLTHENFSYTYSYICDKLGIEEFVDLGAKKATQFNVLSYDENLYLNKNSKIFKSVSAPPSETNKKKKAYSTEWVVGKNIRFDNKSDYLQDDTEIVENWKGMDFIEAKLLFKKVSSNRNNILLSYCNNLVCLNPHIYEDRLFSIMSAVNYNNFINPVSDEQLSRVVDTIMRYNRDGTLSPKYAKKKKKIIFGTNCGLSKEEKFAYVRVAVAKNKCENSKLKIETILNEWDFKTFGKITQKVIYTNHPISKKTIEKYYKDFKEIIEKLNKNFVD